MKLSLAFIFAAIATAYAIPVSKDEIKTKSAQGLRLLRLAEGADPIWVTEREMLQLAKERVGFFDVTDYYDPEADTSKESGDVEIFAYPSGPTRQTTVNPIISGLAVSNLQTYLNKFTSFNNRYYNSDTGKQASDWLFDTITSIIASSPSTGATVQRFSHSWTQSSIIARFPGRQNGPITVLGAHLDSINHSSSNPSTARAPGADDDGSGSISILEAFRGLAASGFQPLNPVEFQWYSAEEVGERGSGAIAASYKISDLVLQGTQELKIFVHSVRPGSTEIIGLIQDYTSSTLNTYTTALAKEYNDIPVGSAGSCGYACSDHASYNANGYPSTFPFEATFANQSPVIHTANDTTSASGFSWTHMLEYSKLAVAFAVELESLMNKKADQLVALSVYRNAVERHIAALSKSSDERMNHHPRHQAWKWAGTQGNEFPKAVTLEVIKSPDFRHPENSEYAKGNPPM
ncbi:hypothetical protein NP233_g1005 [Leucocoprinus birnbaumii]|uniref:Peptide hydrolase n=1 Tax=Leucocoprinus birnbaumii TaxID=56174 RepID=A0AAD5W3N4_9AGAR|nr:hypothetical protein NP233_g1005 [Leucocoprinus birnbaumii]